MNGYAEVLSRDTVRFERLLPASAERVWEYLTDSDKRATWLARGAMEPRAGGKMHLFWKHSELTTADDPIPENYKNMEGGHGFDGEVLAWDPPRLLRISWWSGGSEVTFELTPKGESTLLVLTHERLPNRDQMLSVSGGWHSHLDVLADQLAGRERGPFWKKIVALKGEYETRLPG